MKYDVCHYIIKKTDNYIKFDNGLELDIDTTGWDDYHLIEYANVIVRMKNGEKV